MGTQVDKGPLFQDHAEAPVRTTMARSFLGAWARFSEVARWAGQAGTDAPNAAGSSASSTSLRTKWALKEAVGTVAYYNHQKVPGP